MSLSRVLEPEVMDSLEEARDYNAMDHQEVNQRFVTDLLAAGPLGHDVLDLGTGTALIPVELCKQGDDCRIAACDLATHMLDLARYNVEVAGFRERILLYHVDAKQLPYPDAHFDAVISNSIVHHIPEPRRVLREAVRVTRPGGLLFFRDLLRPTDESTVEHLVATYAGNATAHAQQMFNASLRAALTLDEIRALIHELGWATETVQVTSDRHWTWAARKLASTAAQAAASSSG